MPAYSASGEVNVADPNTLMSLTPVATGVRFKIYEWMVGSASTAPADVALAWKLTRTTVAGTGGTIIVPAALVQEEPATRIIANEAPSTEPTYTADEDLVEVSVNERATFRWVAAPGSEVTSDGTSSAGIGLKVAHASDTDLMQGTVLYTE